MEDYSV